jgi:hypothetical protein
VLITYLGELKDQVNLKRLLFDLYYSNLFETDTPWRKFNYPKDARSEDFNRRTTYGQLGHLIAATIHGDYYEDLRKLKRAKKVEQRGGYTKKPVKPASRKSKTSER